MILHWNQKAFLLSPVYKHLKGIFAYKATDWRKPAKWWFLENDDYGFLQPLYSVYKKSGQFVFQTYLLTCLKKDTSVLLKAVKIWVSE